ncbi:MAG: hypothetical protein REI64_07935 [Pedobacter sp.]|uniref:hypothetical protein n=1 Tax=Pedobacter sp. TaxID=1411316 RepID=UPI00280942AF|nr:hypothetical protein [Pedobacter sp.]MDQ8004713.1 hypothetical protein [Pedobacter sp.]
MTKSHSLTADNKPTLFSFDIETVYKSIERWVYDNKRYSKRDLETDANLLRQVAKDFIDVIETGILTDKQLDNFINAIEIGASGIWEPTTTKLQLLSYHFDNAKFRLIELIKTANSQTIERLLNCISDNLTIAELTELFIFTFKSKSKKIRIKTANIALDTRDERLVPLLQKELNEQSDSKIKEAIQFAINNMHQPKGELTF